MTNPDDPINPPLNGDGYGLTKREHFAALAMQGLMASPRNPGGVGPNDTITSKLITTLACQCADALIAALNA